MLVYTVKIAVANYYSIFAILFVQSKLDCCNKYTYIYIFDKYNIFQKQIIKLNIQIKLYINYNIIKFAII